MHVIIIIFVSWNDRDCYYDTIRCDAVFGSAYAVKTRTAFHDFIGIAFKCYVAVVGIVQYSTACSFSCFSFRRAFLSSAFRFYLRARLWQRRRLL